MKSKILKNSVLIVLVVLISGCAGKLQYTPPGLYNSSTKNSIVVNMSKDDVWAKLVPALGKSFFVINNIDKSSGLINISYSGDPEKYIDCGSIYSYVKNLRGERTYQFPASKGHKIYEAMDKGNYAQIERKMDLSGRMNIIVEEIEKDKTMISVSTRYIVEKSYTINGRFSRSDTVSFNTGQSASFPQGTTCRCNGQFENEVLDIFVE